MISSWPSISPLKDPLPVVLFELSFGEIQRLSRDLQVVGRSPWSSEIILELCGLCYCIFYNSPLVPKLGR